MKTIKLSLPQTLPVLGCLLMVASASAEKAIVNLTDWRDTSGRPISAHEHFVGRFLGAFYWYGTSYKGNPLGQCGPEGAPLQNGFNVYRSTNLVDWHYLGQCLAFPKTGFGSEGTSHRPRVIYNKPAKKYVLWYFYFRKYPDVMLTVATAAAPAGPFVIQGLRKSSEEHGWAQDLGAFQDSDGKAYLVYDDGHRNLRVDLLTDDFLDTTGRSVIALRAGSGQGQQYEGAAMVKYKGKYIVAGSGVTGWNPSDTTYAIADSPLGPYSAPGRLGNWGTWGSQMSSFLYVAETDTLIALCDQWWAGPAGRNDLDQSRYVWIPVLFNPVTREAQMEFRAEWNPFTTQPPNP
ncbi:MAG: family 43 glycosylhydrolase [Verrucomicrobiota bacterium]|jgi:hypothetical protein